MNLKAAFLILPLALTNLFSSNSRADVDVPNRHDEVVAFFLQAANSQTTNVYKEIESVRKMQAESMVAEDRLLPQTITDQQIQTVLVSRDEFVGSRVGDSYADGKFAIFIEYHDFGSGHRAFVTESLRFECLFHAIADGRQAITIDCAKK